MSWKAELREAVRDTIREMMTVPAVSCTVKSVNKQAGTIQATDADEVDYHDVRLKAVVVDGNGAGILVYPEVGSQVVVSLLDGIDTMAYVSQYSDIEEFLITTASGVSIGLTAGGNLLLNGGQFGGLIKIEALVQRINRLEKRMRSHQHISAPAGSPTTTDPRSNNPLTLADTDKSVLENTTVQHG